jgi:hypothetical protein
VSEPPRFLEIDDEGDAALVLEAIDFMMQLRSLSADARQELATIRTRVERFETGRGWE